MPAGVVVLVTGIVIATVALVKGYAAHSAVYTGSPKCDGKVMSPGDRCIVIGGPGGGSYDEMVQHARDHAKSDVWAIAEMIGAGGLLFFLAGVTLILVAVRSSGRRVRTVILLGATVVVAAYSLSIWPAHARVLEVSPIPVGWLGIWWDLDFPYGPLATALLAALYTVGLLIVVEPRKDPAAAVRPEQAPTGAKAAALAEADRAIERMEERHRGQRERDEPN